MMKGTKIRELLANYRVSRAKTGQNSLGSVLSSATYQLCVTLVKFPNL